MAQYRLRAQHVTKDGRVLEAGTIVGDDTSYPWDEPSNLMEGIDDEGCKRVNELHQKLYGTDAEWHRDDLPVPQDIATDEEEVKEVQSQAPVSDQQRAEFDAAHAGRPAPQPLPRPSTVASPSPTAASPGPATPKPPAPEAIRPTNPNTQQPPKDNKP